MISWSQIATAKVFAYNQIIPIGAITNGDYGNTKKDFCLKLLRLIEVEEDFFVDFVFGRF